MEGAKRDVFEEKKKEGAYLASVLAPMDSLTLRRRPIFLPALSRNGR